MVNRRISIMSIYMNYTLTLNVVKCITLFYSSLYRTWSIEGSLWTWWWQLPETRNTSSLFSSLHRTWGEYLLSNEHLGHVDNFFHTSSRREKLSTIVCFFCQPSLCLLYFWDKFQIQVTFRFRTSYRYWMYNLWFLNLLFVLIITLTSLILLCAEIICINIYIYLFSGLTDTWSDVYIFFHCPGLCMYWNVHFCVDSKLGIEIKSSKIFWMPDPDRGQGVLPFEPIHNEEEETQE